MTQLQTVSFAIYQAYQQQTADYDTVPAVDSYPIIGDHRFGRCGIHLPAAAYFRPHGSC